MLSAVCTSSDIAAAIDYTVSNAESLEVVDMPRLTYWQIFRLVDDNTLEVLRKLKIGSVEFDVGALIRRGTLVAGLDLFKFTSLSAEVEGDEDGDTWVLRRIIYTSNA